MVRGLNQMMELVIYDIELSAVPDGAYQGKFQGYRWTNAMQVMVRDHAIESIEIIKPHPFHRQELVDELTERIIEHQTLKVDTVTVATVSSKAFLKAVENALLSD